MGELDTQFVFPQAGPIHPPDPPRPYTLANLEIAHQQATTLWPEVSKQSCANALESHFADGDPSKAIVLIQFYRDALDGYVTSVCARNGSYLPLRGAMNVHGVSCYVDSLLYAMFSRMQNFEPLLYKRHYGDAATDRLATWLRLFVNLLRNGERITEDIVAALMATAVEAGWATSAPSSQQDAAEFFVFITEKLLMPSLVSRVDIAHAGREAAEFDHKMIKEQSLYSPVPGTDEDPPILLEECFEIYFSNVINVSRHLAQPYGGESTQPSQHTNIQQPISANVQHSNAQHTNAQQPNVQQQQQQQQQQPNSPPLGSPFTTGPSSNLASTDLSPTPSPSVEPPSHNDVNEMANTSATWLSSSSHERTAGGAPTNRRRSYSISSLTSSPGFRKGSRTANWDDAYSASPSPSSPSVPSVPLPATPDLTSPNGSSTASNSTVAGSSKCETIPFPGLNRAPRQHPPSPPSDQLFDPSDRSSDAMNSSDTSQQTARNSVPPAPGSSAPTPSNMRRSVEPDERPGSSPSYHQLFGFNEDRQAEARVRDMKQTSWTSNNEVMLPAWMFLQLMPFYADNMPTETEPITNLEADEVAHHFRKARPVSGICLKRYFVDENGMPQRNNRKVIIPETINMPSFVADDSDHKQAFGKFKLVLESAISHRGSSIHSGHYCALSAEPSARPNVNSNNLSKLNLQHNGLTTPEAKRFSSWSQNSLHVPPSPLSLQGSPPSPVVPIMNSPSTMPPSPSGSSGNSPTPTSSEGTPFAYGKSQSNLSAGRKWYLFDDVQSGGDRVKEVNHTEVFEKESPYMSFYRMVSLEEEEKNEKYGFASSSNASGNGSSRPPSSSSVSTYDPSSRPPSRPPSPELSREKDKKKKTKFFRRNKEKDPQREKDKFTKDYASKYREEKCTLM